MTYEFFDIHCHLFTPPEENTQPESFFFYSRDQLDMVHRQLREHKIGALNCACDHNTIARINQFIDGEYLYGAVGFHPEYVTEFDQVFLEQILEKSYIRVIGEIGLDTGYRKEKQISDEEDARIFDQQKQIFTAQIKLAQQKQKAITVHLRGNREVFETAYTLLQQQIPLPPVNMHFFTGSKKIALRCIEAGYYFSFNATLLYVKELQDLCRLVPRDRILTETDSPFINPAKDNTRNMPTTIPMIVKKIEELHSMPMQQQIVENSLRYLQLNNIIRTT